MYDEKKHATWNDMIMYAANTIMNFNEPFTAEQMIAFIRVKTSIDDPRVTHTAIKKLMDAGKLIYDEGYFVTI